MTYYPIFPGREKQGIFPPKQGIALWSIKTTTQKVSKCRFTLFWRNDPVLERAAPSRFLSRSVDHVAIMPVLGCVEELH
jgi:hypothetical protein